MILTTWMAHQRTLIRHAAVALLMNATAAGARVEGTRTAPHRKTHLPALAVYTEHDPVLVDKSGETEDVHELELKIVGWVALPPDAEDDADAIDDLAAQVETVMIANPFLSFTAAKTQLVETVTQIREADGASDPRIGIAILTYAVEYQQPLAPESALDDFLRAKATYELVGGIEDDTAPASDEFIVQETPP